MSRPRLLGRIRARYLTARLPNPPVRPVRAAFTAHGSRERDIYGHFHFARIPPKFMVYSFARSLGTFVSFSYPLPKGLRHVRGFPAFRLLCPI